MATLGALSMLELSVEEIVREIVEADDFLKEQKGLGFWGIGSAQRLMYAALLVMDTYMPPAAVMQNAVMGSSLAMVIAQEVATAAVIINRIVWLVALPDAYR